MHLIENMNWLTVPVGGIIFMFVGAFWYSPLMFGKMWMDEMGMVEADFEGHNPAPAMIKSFATSMITTFAMGILLNLPGLQGADYLGGAKIGLFVALFFGGIAVYPNYAFEMRSVRHWLIHVLYLITCLVSVGALVGGWR